MAILYSRSWYESQLGWLVITLCIHQSLLLWAGGNNVVEREYYTQTSRKTGWFLFEKTVYRRQRHVYYACRSGWFSNNDISCDYAICNGRTNLNGACNDYFGNSHIINADGSVQYYPGGTCNTPGICTCRNQGFYSVNNFCAMCSAIANCNLETCTSSTDQTCSRCEGVVQERAGYRAYRVSTDRRRCEKTCSWRTDSTRCYPGTCSNELASSCSCATGFTGQHCNIITAQATITYNELTLTSQDNTSVTVPPDVNGGPSAEQNDVWTNLKNLSAMTYTWTGQFLFSAPTYHAYITDFKVGVVGGSSKFVLYRGTEVHQFESACEGANRTDANKNDFNCSSTILAEQLTKSFPTSFHHRDRLDYSFSASVGGFVKVNNMESRRTETFIYAGNTKEHLFQLNFDLVPPHHCSVSSDCNEFMLLVTDISRTAVQLMTWDGWQDDDAGISYFFYRVFSLHELGGVLRHKSSVAQGTVTATSSGNASLTLTEPGMYAVVLTAQDRASNTKMARRLILYDATSQITINQSTDLRVTSAAPETAWTWQQTEGSVTVSWTNRYVNSFHHNNQLLAAVGSEPDVSSDYDDNEGLRTLSAIPNVLGIVKFETAFKVDREGGKNMTTPSDNSFTLETNLNTTKTIPGLVTDGQSFTFWVRAYDVRGDYFQESVTVHVDSSPPVIENLWLTKDHFENISVHGLEDLDKMTIEWLAYDDQSGLESVRWRLIDNFNNTELVLGAANVSSQGESVNLEHCRSKYETYARGPNCYCTGLVGCYHRHFQVKPNITDVTQQAQGGIFSNASYGVHGYDYFLEVIVCNHAKLSTTLRKKISLDTSSPAPGVVYNGMVGSPEVDFQSSRILRAYWSGFFDRESGVKFYQYAFHTACLDNDVFGHNTQDGRVFVTNETTATWTAPGEGLYYVTVVAFNNAIQPSSRVCSDGVTVDTSPPVVSQVDIENAHVPSGLVRGEGSDVWLIESNRRRRMVYKPDKTCIDKATVLNLTKNEPPLHLIELFPLHEIVAPIPAVNACQQEAFDPRFSQSLYLSTDRLIYMNWTGDDPESGIQDYEVGLATSASITENPDLSPYTSTNHLAFYRALHPSLTEGAPFYIFIRATNRADLSSVVTVGPVTLIRKPSSYVGNVTLTLASNGLVASWDLNLLTDVEPQFLKFTVALEEETNGATLQLHAPPRFHGNCVESRPPSCTTFDFNDIDWHLYKKHIYLARVKITNIVGLDLHLTSLPYVHDNRLPSRGTVYDVVPEAEEEILAVKRSEDTDFQLSRTVYEGRWFGFEDETQPVTYWVAAGTQPGSDDIARFLHVGTVNSFTFTNLSFLNESTYYFTVTAMTPAGNVTVSSDGVRIIRDNHLVEGIQILDGCGCSSYMGNRMLQNSLVPQNLSDLLLVPCEEDDNFQMSRDKFSTHWMLTSEQRRRYPDVQWKVQKAISGTNSWYDVTQYGPSSGPDSTTAEGLSLQAGGRYRAAVRFCVGNACSMPLYSSGVFVLSGPPITGAIETSYKLTGNGSVVEVTFEMFKDVDIKDFVAAKSVMVGYQWSLAEKSDVMRLLQPWKTVQDLKVINDTHSRFTANFTGQLNFQMCLHLAVRGIGRLGLTSVLSTPVKDCRLTDPVLTVLDAVGETVQSDHGDGVTLALNAVWSQEDRNYTPHTNVISAVWPSVRHLRISWTILSSAGPEVKSHYLAFYLSSLQDSCSIPGVIACGDVSDQKYVNVFFGPNSGRPLLENGHHYYVCIHAESQTLAYENWNEALPAIHLCSDGVTVDTTPPQAGTVLIDGLIGGLYLTTISVVRITWYGFNDIEALGHTPHHSGILRYHVAIGSSISGEDVIKFKDVGLVNKFMVDGLSLQNGHKYFITVKAEDHVGRFAEAWNTTVVDCTPPAKMTSQFLFPLPYLPSATVVSVCWKNMFRDEESGVVSYIVTLGSSPGQSDVMESKEIFSECVDFERSLIEGHAYYFTVKAINGANLQTAFSSHEVIRMTMAPSLGHVFDSRPTSIETMNIDVDLTTSYDDSSAYWSGFTMLVTSHTAGLGTCSVCRDVFDDFDIGLMQVTTAAVTTEVAGQCRAVFKCAREFQGKIRSPDTTRVDVCRAVDDYVTCYLNNCHGEETLPDAQKNFLQREMGKKGFDCEIPSSLKTSTTVVTTSTALITTAILATTSPPQSDLSSTDAPSLTEVGESVETQSTQGISLATDDTTLESLYTWTTDDVGSADTLSTQRDADEYETTSIDQVTSAEAYDGESEITFSIEDEKEVSSLDTWTSDTWISGTASVKETVSTTGAIEKDEDIKKPSEQEDTKLTTAEFNKALGTLDAVLADNTTFSNTSTSEKVVTVISELMRADVTQFKESSTDSVSAASRVLQVVDNLLEKVELTDGQFMSTAPNLIVAAREVNASTFTGLALITNADEKDLETPEFQSSPTVAENVNRVSSLALPASLLSSVSNATEVRISMTVHRTAVLFEAIRRNVSRPANSSDYVREINSHVLSASVVGFHITNMTDPVTIVLAHHKQNSVGPECVFWDSNINDWSTEGCWMKKENITDSRTICECNHLTNFALLMDVYSTGSSVGETDRKILSVVSYIGCGASLLALLLTLITYGVFGGFRNVRRPSLQERNQRDNPSKILLNLCVALALTNLVFMAGMHDHAFKSLPACKFVAAFLHFSLLAALGWMAVEAVYMYLALVLVFKTNYNNFLLKCSLAGWGAPLVITVITLGVNKTDNYGMLDSGVCWLKGNAFYIAFLAPICAILLMNFIVFGLVMRRIMGLSERKLNKSDTYTAKKQLRGAVGVVILLGLTWVFAIFAIDRASIVFNYLFAIFNSLQGLFIFLYNCLLKKEIRTAWMNKFRWIRMREETTDLTTSKANYLRVTNIGTSTGKSEQYPDDSTACSAVADTSVNEAHSTMIEMTSSTQDSDKATPTQSANTPNDVLDINPLTSTAKEPSLTTVDESTSAATDTDVCTSESETKVLATCGPGPDISTPQSRTNTDTPVNGQTNMMSCTFQLTTNIITTAAPVGDVNVAPPILTVPTVSMDTLADTTIPVIVDTPLYISTLNVPPLQVSSSDI